MIAQIKDISLGLKGELQVTFTLPRQYTDELKALMNEQLDLSVEKHRDKRSLTANSYAWVLIGKIAEKIWPPLSKDEVYVEMLKRYGQGTAITVLTSRVNDVKRELDYYEVIRNAISKGKEYTHLRIWVGSSKYNTKEMSVFIEGIISEAQELGIDTASPTEIQRLTDKWEARYGR